MSRLASLSILAALILVAPACGPSGGDDGSDAGIPDLPDADGDGIADVDEGRADDVDTDNDGTPDYLDTDSDDDGIPDYREAGDDLTGTPPVDSDGDGTPDFQDTDSDDNGRPDGVDGTADLDTDGIGNFADLDDDGDGITDVTEIGGNPDNPLDSDNDGTPDFQDIDSDNDTIMDKYEGAGDFDEDDLPAYLDTDADGDCIPDLYEAGDEDLNTPPVDTDGDGQYDFLDLDSDNDGLLDELEDSNCNGTQDAGESSPTDSDSDDDGVSDLIENAAGTDPTDPGDNPQANGDFVFVVPYEDTPDPENDTLDFSTDVSQADVVFVMDTTGSMCGEIANLKTSLQGTLIDQIAAQVPNTGFGVVDYRDFPYGTYGSSGDFPFILRHRVMTTTTGAGRASINSAVGAYACGGGADGPEALWEALFQTASGTGFTNVGSYTVPAFNPASAPPASIPAGEEVGDIGGVGFRTGSLPIAIFFTDAPGHNSDIGTANDYSFGGSARSTDAINAMLAVSARVIGVTSGAGDIITQALGVANATGAVVPPTAWGPVGTRPGTCAIDQCCTGQNGAGEAASGGQCPLVFKIDASGNGLGGAVATAVEALTGYAVLDISALAQDDPGDSVDAVAEFVERIEANPSAGAPCAPGLVAIDVSPADGINDTFDDVTPGTVVCYDVVPKMNTTVPPLETPQMFEANIVVEGDHVTTLDTRTIYFLVPPEIEDIPIG